MELTAGKQLHLGNYPENINKDNKQLLRIWIQLRGARKEKKKEKINLWSKLSLPLFIYHCIDDSQAVVFCCVHWHF